MPRYVWVKGRRIDQDALRAYLSEITDYAQYEQEDGTWKSPISGEFYATRDAMFGSFGSYLQNREPLSLREPTRRGYIRAIRHGVEPTEAQKKAHAEYMKDHRRKKKHGELIETAIESANSREAHDGKTARLKTEKQERTQQRRADSDAAYQREQEERRAGANVVSIRPGDKNLDGPEAEGEGSQEESSL